MNKPSALLGLTAHRPSAASHDNATRSQSQPALRSVQRHAMPEQHGRIPIESIDILPTRQRRLTEAEFGALSENIRQHGLLHPITVRQLPGGRYELVAGHNRLSVAKKLNWKEIDADIRDLKAETADLHAFYSNLMSTSLTDFEKYIGFSRRKALTGFTHDELAKESGVSRPLITRLMAFAALPAEAQALLANAPHRLASHTAATMKSYIDEGNAATVIAAIRRLVQDEDLTQAQALAIAKPPATHTTVRSKPELFKAGRRVFGRLQVAPGRLTLTLIDPRVEQRLAEIIRTAMNHLAAEG
jgi:ParB family chromosome partitioning protein